MTGVCIFPYLKLLRIVLISRVMLASIFLFFSPCFLASCVIVDVKSFMLIPMWAYRVFSFPSSTFTTSGRPSWRDGSFSYLLGGGDGEHAVGGDHGGHGMKVYGAGHVEASLKLSTRLTAPSLLLHAALHHQFTLAQELHRHLATAAEVLNVQHDLWEARTMSRLSSAQWDSLFYVALSSNYLSVSVFSSFVCLYCAIVLFRCSMLFGRLPQLSSSTSRASSLEHSPCDPPRPRSSRLLGSPPSCRGSGRFCIAPASHQGSSGHHSSTARLALPPRRPARRLRRKDR